MPMGTASYFSGSSADITDAVSGKGGDFRLIGRCVYNQVKLQLPASLNHALGAVWIALAGQLHDDFVFALSVGSHEGLRQAQRVNAAANRFFGLIHCCLLDIGDSRGRHRNQISGRFTGSGRNVPIRKLIGNQVASGSGLLRGNGVNQNLRVAQLADFFILYAFVAQ
jgi:hypothetical protein